MIILLIIFLYREINTLFLNIINVKNHEHYKNQNIKGKFKDLICFLLKDSLIENNMKIFDIIKTIYLE